MSAEREESRESMRPREPRSDLADEPAELPAASSRGDFDLDEDFEEFDHIAQSADAGLEPAEVDSTALPDEMDDDAGLDEKHAKGSVRDILTWKEAVGMIVEVNMQARAVRHRTILDRTARTTGARTDGAEVGAADEGAESRSASVLINREGKLPPRLPIRDLVVSDLRGERETRL